MDEIKRGNLYIADLDPVKGSEQGGRRPVLVVQNDAGNTKLIKLSRGNVQLLYNKEFKISESVVKLVKTIMNTSMAFALDKKMISVNPAEGGDLPKQKKKTEFRTRRIDEQKTLTQKQVEILINAAKKLRFICR